MPEGGHVVVIGGSIGGLCAARALQSRFERITILEQDVIPTEPAGRRGTPQAWHNHFLLAAGREAIEKLFPGYLDRLLANGGAVLDPAYDAVNCLIDGWAPRSRGNSTMTFASRLAIESTIREFVADDPGITFIEQARVQNLTTRPGTDGRPVITGVEYRDEQGQIHSLEAEFVVDTAGRGSKAGSWMSEWGQEPELQTLDAKVSYSSRWYRWPEGDDNPWWRWLTTFPDPNPHAPEQHQYLCSINTIENDCFIAVMGSWGLDMPTDVESYEAAARQTRTREFARMLDASKPITDVHHTRSTRNVWRRFDQLSRPPRGFIALGDSVCAFNPIYAQGMSCAAVGAVILRELSTQTDPLAEGFPKAFYAEQAKFLKGAWALALTRDGAYAHATGTEALPDGIRRRLLRKATWPVFQFVALASFEDQVIGDHFNRVFNLQETVQDLAKNPRVLAGLAFYGVKLALGLSKVPPRTDPQLPPSGADRTGARDLPLREVLAERRAAARQKTGVVTASV
ncbi:hypothetical protein [Mycobacterium sp. 94-17]|uniref:FAD-dependent oxidoreductase n=1 Tax=Mycobacterium sp. 94-17 TaxID=2986147 RepID=UPI002D1EF814|nr:hypothetical protein [Mycobacterium sp. 94-17]MEB4209549.1 hypothetical protein [Mycobacterium sp. 94-17]